MTWLVEKTAEVNKLLCLRSRIMKQSKGKVSFQYVNKDQTTAFYDSQKRTTSLHTDSGRQLSPRRVGDFVNNKNCITTTEYLIYLTNGIKRGKEVKKEVNTIFLFTVHFNVMVSR